MQSNQRARLVLHPVVLVAAVVIAGLAVGLGIVWRQTSETSDARANGAGATMPIAGLQISSDHLDFGDVGIDRSVSLQLRLGNSGPDPIELRIEGAESFVVVPRHLIVRPNGSSRVMVTANATKPGAIQDQLRLIRNGGAEPSLVVTLAANGSSDPIAMRRPSGSAGEPVNAGQGDPIVAADMAGAGSSDPSPAGSGGPTGPNGAPQPAGSVQISRTMGEKIAEDGDSNAASAGGRAPSGSGSVVGVAPDVARLPRSMADPVIAPATGPAAGEEPVPLPPGNPRDAAELDQKKDPPASPDDSPQAPAFVVASTSSLSLMGTANQFYPQQIGVFGSEAGGSFTLMTGIQFPRVPLAFGQSVAFAQSGAAVGSYSSGSGQVELHLTLSATDSNGNTAPVQMRLTTGSVVTRNNNGVLISINGQPRESSSGQLRLVGIGKIPLDYGNHAEDQLVIVQIVAALGFGSAGSGSSGGGQ